MTYIMGLPEAMFFKYQEIVTQIVQLTYSPIENI